MKIIITERQLKKIYTEQETGFTRRLDRIYSNADTASKYNSEIIDFYKKYKHEINMIASIGLSFIPLVGPILGTTIALVDAKQYYDENDKKTAGMVALFSILPFVGPLVSKIPGIKELGVKGMSALASKLGKGQKLTETEQKIVTAISNNGELIQSQVPKVATQIAKKTIPQKIGSFAGKTVKAVAPYVAAGAAYNKGYDYVQRNNPRTKAEKENFDWENVKLSFGSSGSAQDNMLLNKAWDKGWRPGQVVPKKFQTLLYQKNYNEESENINKLQQLIAQYKE